MNYYNEIDPYAAQWLRNLIEQGLIPPGDVDERSIEDVLPVELMGYTQCHFFAGIGGWSYALRLAGWPADKKVWTGSCPCQPFSQAGKGKGFADERHLWPSWLHLIQQCRPDIIFGEQVASALDWLDLVSADLEGTGYTFAASDLCAASVAAPHIRQRLFWVADSSKVGRGGGRLPFASIEKTPERAAPIRSGLVFQSQELRQVGGLGNSIGTGLEGFSWYGNSQAGWQKSAGPAAAHGAAGPADAHNGFWPDFDWLGCLDGVFRPVEPGTFPMAHGVPARVGKLRAYGNAIVPQVAAEFVKAYMEC